MTGRCRAAWSKPTRFLAVAIGAGWIGYFLAYVISFYDLTWHLVTSATRTTGQLLGAIVLFLACVLRDVIAERRTRGVDARSGAG